MARDFESYPLPLEGNQFATLAASARLQVVGKGRSGSVLVRAHPTRGVPIVRTTTRYDVPAQCFTDLHVRLAEQIQEVARMPHALNNGLIERYTPAYTKMGFHSDQALDLVAGSFIAVFSCYRTPPDGPAPRRLVVRSKPSGGAPFDVPLEHNGVVVFSLDTNRRFTHKIVPHPAATAADNEWLGITLRTSGTWVRVDGDTAVFEDGTPLALADEKQRTEFYRLRGRENREPGFTYPPLSYTISPSDRMPPTAG